MSASASEWTFVDLLRERAARQPLAEAFRFLHDPDQQRPLTWGELDARARAVAASLQERITPSDRVLVMCERSRSFLEAFFGCLYAGAIAVPVPAGRSRRHLDRLRGIAADAGAAFVQVDDETTFTAVGANVLPVASIVDAMAERWRPLSPPPNAVAFLQYTSGSTAQPRGVRVTHANLRHNALALADRFGDDPDAVTVAWVPLFHDMGLVANVLQTVFSGSRAIVMPPAAFLQRPARWLQAMSDHGATRSGGPNFAFQLCVDAVADEELTGIDLSGWQVAFAGGETNRRRVMERFVSRFAQHGFCPSSLVTCYGLAEATLFVSGGTPGAAALAVDGSQARPLVGAGSAGRGVRIAIVDPDTSRVVADGSPGEIWLAGPMVADGYWGQPEVTTGVFGARLAHGDAGAFLRTGDIGIIRDGELYPCGRLKDTIIIRGKNHSADAVEEIVQSAHTALAASRCAAFGVDGDESERLIVLVERPAGAQPSIDTLAAAARASIGDAHGVAAEVLFVRRGTLPRTSSGKIPRHRCREQYLAGHVRLAAETGPGRNQATSKTDEAGAGMASALRTDIAGVLGCPSDAIALDDRLANHGLDSLSAFRLSEQLLRRWHTAVPVAALLDGATLRDLISATRHSPEAGGAGAGDAATPDVVEFPLTHRQRGVWFHQQLAPDSTVYNVTAAARLPGGVDLPALERVFAILISRHPLLRATIHANPSGPPFQRIVVMPAPSIERIVVTGGDAARRQRITHDASAPFDLEHGPLFRVRLYEANGSAPVLLLVLHHLIADYWSVALLTRELCHCYASIASGREPSLPPVAGTYAAEYRREERLLSGANGEALARSWGSRLDGASQSHTGLGALQRRGERHRGGSFLVEVDPALYGDVCRLARESASMPYVVLLATFFTLLHRYTGQQDLVVAFPTAGRSAGFGDVVGLFVNVLPLRVAVSGDRSFAELLSRVRHVVREAFAHQDYPFSLMRERLQGPVQPASLATVMFGMQKAAVDGCDALSLLTTGAAGVRVGLDGVLLESFALDDQPAQWDLQVMASEAEGRLVLVWKYDATLFEAGAIASMADAYQRLLAAAVRQPATKADDLSLIASVPIAAPTPARWVGGIHEMFERQADATPDAVALIDTREAVTFGAWEERANQIARVLLDRGLEPETPVGICMERSVAMMAAVLGVLKAGCAYVPLDPSYPSERLSLIAADCRVPVVLTDAPGAARLPAAIPALRWDSDIIRQAERTRISRAVRPQQAAYVIYTSGSTGRPKGIVGLHGGALNRFEWMWDRYPFAAGEVCCQKTSLTFLDSLWEVFGPALRGVPTLILSDAVVHDPERMLALLSDHRVTRLVLVPSLLRALLDAWPCGADAAPDLHTWVSSGEALEPQLASRFRERLPGRRLLNLYGSSEVSADATYHEVAPADAAYASLPIGSAIAGLAVLVLDGRCRPVPAGMAGEIYVGGIGLARGYVGRPDLTAERFVPHPWAHGERLYRTGDRGRILDDGMVQLLGRVDRQVKIRGFRIELGEVEVALRSHPSVAEAVVLAEGATSSDRRLVAYVMASGGAALSAPGLREHVQQRLPAYMCPALFKALDALPLTDSGKIDRLALPQVDARVLDGSVAGGAPASDLERLIAGVWTEVLGRSDIGRDDNFFDLGGHSLLATQVVSRLRATLSADVELRGFFGSPTVRALAECIAAARTTVDLRAIARQPRRGPTRREAERRPGP